MVEKRQKKIRTGELELTKQVSITEEVHKILKKQKAVQEKSMARLIHDLVIQTYGNA